MARRRRDLIEPDVAPVVDQEHVYRWLRRSGMASDPPTPAAAELRRRAEHLDTLDLPLADRVEQLERLATDLGLVPLRPPGPRVAVTTLARRQEAQAARPSRTTGSRSASREGWARAASAPSDSPATAAPAPAPANPRGTP